MAEEKYQDIPFTHYDTANTSVLNERFNLLDRMSSCEDIWGKKTEFLARRFIRESRKAGKYVAIPLDELPETFVHCIHTMVGNGHLLLEDVLSGGKNRLVVSPAPRTLHLLYEYDKQGRHYSLMDKAYCAMLEQE
jgi:hypothetical protein